MAMRKPIKKKARKLPPNALQYCPQYIAWDREARKESKTRFRQHVTERRKLLVQCIDPALNDIRNPVLRLQFSSHPTYHDDDNIINTAFNAIDNKINEWNGVQFSNKFVAVFNEDGTQMNKKQFDKGATNHQDQTSWKVSGNKFFAPYISEANRYFHRYCQCITNIGEKERHEIYKLTCISYATTLLSKAIKFHRTKGKPLIRHKTLKKSEGIHIELECLYPELKVRSFFAAAKKKAKENGKNTVNSEEFHDNLLHCCSTLYRDQKKKVYHLLNISMEYEMKERMETNVYPKDLMDPEEDNDDDDGYKPYQSPSYSTNSTQSTQVTEPRRSRASSSPREFQRVDPRDFTVRNDMKRNRNRERRRYRESILNERNREHREDMNISVDDEDHISTQSDTLLTDESVYNHQSSFSNDMESRTCRECGQTCHCQQPVSDPKTIQQQELQRENDALKRELLSLELELFSIQRQLYPLPYNMQPPPNHMHGYFDALPPPIQFQPPMMMRRRSSNPIFMDDMMNFNDNVGMMDNHQDINVTDSSSLPNMN